MSWRILSVVDQSREWLPADGFYNRLLFEELSEKRKKRERNRFFCYFRGCDRRKPKCVFILCIFFYRLLTFTCRKVEAMVMVGLVWPVPVLWSSNREKGASLELENTMDG